MLYPFPSEPTPSVSKRSFSSARRVLVAIEDLRTGGAQTFALRFAQALHDAGHQVWVYSMYWQYSINSALCKLAPDVTYVYYQPSAPQLDMVLQRAENWFERKGLEMPLRTRQLQQHLFNFMVEESIEIVSSNMFRCDELLSQALERLPQIPLIVTMHGDYEQFLAFYRAGQEYAMPNYPARLAKTISRIDGIAYLAEQNLEVLRPDVVPANVSRRPLVRRIYNGLSARFSSPETRCTRASLGIPEQAFVFGMVARGVAGKGWQPLVEAYRRLRSETLRSLQLVLVGSGPAIDELQKLHGREADILFTGFADNPVDYVDCFDVGILASALRESLPNSIAEYLFCGKPTISTDIGEVRNMLRTEDNREAGLLIDFPAKGLADANQLYSAMRRYIDEPSLLAEHQELAQKAKLKFDMERCVEAYEALYEDCIKAKQLNS